VNYISEFWQWFRGVKPQGQVEQVQLKPDSLFERLLNQQQNAQQRRLYHQGRSTLRGPHGETYDPLERLPNPFESNSRR
jgi:hypothetical protein